MSTTPELTNIDWLVEYENKSDLWQAQRTMRHQAMRDTITRGGLIVLLQPLTKRPMEKGEGETYLHYAFNNLGKLEDKIKQPKYEDCNYGIVTGLGRFSVVDVEASGVNELTSWLDDKGITLPMDGPRVITASGGFHLYFRDSEDIFTGIRVFKNGPAVDIFSSDGDRRTNQVVGPESVVYDPKKGINGTYKIKTKFPDRFVDLPPFPESLVVYVNQPARSVVHGDFPKKGQGRGNENVETSDLPERVHVADLTEILSHIPNTPGVEWDVWIKILFVAREETMEPDKAKEIFFEWSRKSPKHDEEKTEYEWHYQDKKRDAYRGYFGRAHFGSLVHWAKENGYRPSFRAEVLAKLQEINTTSPSIYPGGQQRFVSVDERTGVVSFSTKEDITGWYEKQRIEIVTDKGVKRVNPIPLFMQWQGRTRYVSPGLYPPGGPECPPDVFNIWRGYNVKPESAGDPAALKNWFDLLERLIPDEECRNWVMDWITNLVKTPGAPCTTMIIMRGPEGNGKDMFWNTILELFKQAQRAKYTDTTTFLDKHNEDELTCVFTVVDEAVFAGDPRTSGILKGKGSQEPRRINPKNVRPFYVESHAHYVIITNEDFAVPAGEGSRRYMVLDTAIHPDWPKGHAKWGKLRTELKSEKFLSSLLYYFLARDITNDIHKPIETEALRHQRMLTRENMERYDRDVDIKKTVLWLLEEGVAYNVGNSWSWPNLQVKMAYRAANEKKVNVSDISNGIPKRLRMWISKHMKIELPAHGKLFVKPNIGGVNASRGIYLIPLNDMRRAYERYASMPNEHLEIGEWALPDEDFVNGPGNGF